MIQAKEMLEAAGFEKGGQTVVIGGATLAGFVASAFSLPFDFVKTRIQKMEKGPDGKYPYKGPLDCAVKTFTQEGPLKFYTGISSCKLHACVSSIISSSSGQDEPSGTKNVVFKDTPLLAVKNHPSIHVQ